MANEQNLKPFKKGDPRINRNGRPKSFDALRKLMQEQAGEIALDGNGNPITDKNGRPRTNAEMFVEAWMKDRKQRKSFAEFAWGKPKEELDITSGGKPIETKVDNERFNRAISTLADALRESISGAGAKPDGDVGPAE